MNTNLKPDPLDNIRRYYGKVLQSSNDLKADACSATESLPQYISKLIADVHLRLASAFTVVAHHCRRRSMAARCSTSVEDLAAGIADNSVDAIFSNCMINLPPDKTVDILAATRYARHFRVIGDKLTHYGLFDCGAAVANVLIVVGGPICC
jgi:hypothetical protein